ncbi:MAG: hypothetical protein ABI425_04940 [Patescibacteria group bacterium]
MTNELKENSLYTNSYWDIFWKNFLVGFARGLGGLATYLILLVIVYYAFLALVLPKISPFLTAFQKTQDNLERLQNPGSMLNGLFQKNSKSIELDTPTTTR